MGHPSSPSSPVSEAVCSWSQIIQVGGAAAAPMRPYFVPTRSSHLPFSVLHYGIAGLGVGETPHTADAQGGRGGVGIKNSLPWVAAGPPVMQEPVKVSRVG